MRFAAFSEETREFCLVSTGTTDIFEPSAAVATAAVVGASLSDNVVAASFVGGSLAMPTDLVVVRVSTDLLGAAAAVLVPCVLALRADKALDVLCW
jgi:hypothetical protein